MKLQIALDYLMVFTFLLFIFILTFGSIAKQRVIVSNQQTFAQLQLVAQTIAAELSSAAQAGNGYSATIVLPQQLSILEYNVSITKQGMVIASSNVFGQQVQASAFSLVQGVVSNSIYLSPNRLYYIIPTLESSGYVTIQNSYGTICVDYQCPLTLNQSSQLILYDQVASALKLNGFNTNALLTSPVTTSQTESVTFWIKPSVTNSNNQYIIDQGAELGSPGSQNNWMELINGQLIGGPSSAQDCGSSILLNPNKWYFVAYTVTSGGFLDIYVNGNQNLGCNNPVVTPATPASLNIGESAAQVQNTYLNASLSNMQIYSNTLTAEQVLDLYSEGITGAPVYSANVAAWYPFAGNGNDYTGNTLHNLQINGPALFPSVAQIFANAYNTSGYALSNVSVGFVTTSGSFSNGQATTNSTNANGLAQVFLNQGNLSNYALVDAVAFNGNSFTKGNVLAWWPAFDGQGTVLHDVSTRSNTQNVLNGNMIGSSWAVPATVARFDGSTSMIQIPDYSALQATPVTISAWVNYIAPSQSQQNFIISKPGAWEIGTCTSNFLVCIYNPSTGAYTYSNSIIAPGQWHMLTEVVSSSATTVFVDGVQVLTASTSVSSSANGIQIGYASIGSSPSFFNGSITNLQIYPSALAASTISNSFRFGITGVPYPNTIGGWWPLSGNANDYGGNGYNGVILGNLNFVSLSQIPTAASQQVPVLGGYFAGSGNYVSIANSNTLTPNANVVVTAWIDSPSTSGADPVFYVGSGSTDTNGYELEVNSGGHYASFTVKAGAGAWGTCVASLSSGQSLNNGNLHFIAGSYNGTYATLYVDGAVASTVQCQSTPTAINYAGTATGYIGADSSTGAAGYLGYIYNVQLYNSTMSDAQIFQIYQEGLGGFPLQGKALAGWWPLDGDVKDYSVNTNNGVNQNYVSFKSAQLTSSYLAPSLGGAGLVFNGTAGNVIVKSKINLNLPFTVSAWVNPDRPAGNEIVVAQLGSFRLGMNWVGKGEADFYGYVGSLKGPLTSPYALNYNQWNMITGVYNGTALTLFQNGVPVNVLTATGTAGTSGNTNPILIGSSENSPYNTHYFNGTIADVQIYNVSLTSAQVYQLYNVGIPPAASITVPLGDN